MGDIVRFKQPGSNCNSFDSTIKVGNPQNPGEVPHNIISTGNMPVVNDPSQKSHVNIPGAFFESGSQKSEASGRCRQPSIVDQSPDQKNKSDDSKPENIEGNFTGTNNHKQDCCDDNKQSFIQKITGPVKRGQPKTFMPKGIAEFIEDDRAVFIFYKDVFFSFIACIIGFITLIIDPPSHTATPLFREFPLLTLPHSFLAWYLFAIPLHFVMGLVCMAIGAVVGRRVIFWRATRTFKGPHPWSGKETETWEWEREMNRRGMLWEAVAILLMIIIPGLLPMFFYNSIFPPSFHFSVWYWLITSVVASFFVLGKKYAEEWYNLVIPRWSVRWYFREKGR